MAHVSCTAPAACTFGPVAEAKSHGRPGLPATSIQVAQRATLLPKGHGPFLDYLGSGQGMGRGWTTGGMCPHLSAFVNDLLDTKVCSYMYNLRKTATNNAQISVLFQEHG